MFFLPILHVFLEIKEQSPPPQVPPPPQLSPGQQPITKIQTNYQPITKADTKHLLNSYPARNGNAIPSPPTRTHPKKQYKHNRNLSAAEQLGVKSVPPIKISNGGIDNHLKLISLILLAVFSWFGFLISLVYISCNLHAVIRLPRKLF